jgi:hypothetical protein
MIAGCVLHDCAAEHFSRGDHPPRVRVSAKRRAAHVDRLIETHRERISNVRLYLKKYRLSLGDRDGE